MEIFSLDEATKVFQQSLSIDQAQSSFNSVYDTIAKLNQPLVDADKAAQQVALGNLDNLHQTMSTIRQAKITLEAAMQIRNTALEAYKELMQTQV
ncbi:flagellar hook-basal body complex protein FliE [Spartinivicinus ruber]|uniref:flagellar hook-basal body complex protein FliE n=1 Tax=Spartinivicinus ruber TaxID=2683272 RepID=UPI0013D463B3|nr:flagellar hook-basal body complex protein FliE [Spartinivicinus ruber]